RPRCHPAGRPHGNRADDSKGVSRNARCGNRGTAVEALAVVRPERGSRGGVPVIEGDRKSTRLNSSHGSISYAVFCLKKKINMISFSPNHFSSPLRRWSIV